MRPGSLNAAEAAIADAKRDGRTSLLTELDPQQRWGGLSPVERPEDRRVVYLCREHVRTLHFPYDD